jgi:hypothetical protein
MIRIPNGNTTFGSKMGMNIPFGYNGNTVWVHLKIGI